MASLNEPREILPLGYCSHNLFLVQPRNKIFPKDMSQGGMNSSEIALGSERWSQLYLQE